MIFSDYRLIYKFAEDCGADIDKHQCGRLEDDDEVRPAGAEAATRFRLLVGGRSK